MNGTFRPRILHDVAVRPTEPQAVVEGFLGALVAADFPTAAALLDEDVAYVNVGMPTVRGRRRTMGILRGLGRPRLSFEVYIHAIAANGTTVLTDRTDVLVVGACRFQFWVTGRFEVQDGKITLWRDSFDYVDIVRALARGFVGAVVPVLRPKAPASPDVAPGRH